MNFWRSALLLPVLFPVLWPLLSFSQEEDIFSRFKTGTENSGSSFELAPSVANPRAIPSSGATEVPQNPSAPTADETEVIYFGGYGATQAQMDCWAGGAKSLNYNITALPYPSGAPAGYNRAIERTSKYQRLLQQIKAHPNKKYKVGGHSSGSQYANNLVQWMLNNGVPAANIELSNLDGFKAPSNLRSKVKWQCWSATNGRINSNNYSSECKILKTTRCQTKWCLHFMLVNSEAPNNLSGGGDFIRRGYAKNNCQSPTDWIDSTPDGRRVTPPAAPARR